MPPKLTLQQQNSDGAVIQAKRMAQQAQTEFEAALDDLTTNWANLTAQQRNDAIRRMVIILARVVRWLVTRA